MLVIENQTNAEISVVSGDHTYPVGANKAQRVDWPDPHIVTVSAEGCSRAFNLDEFYNPWNDWRDQNGELSRRYAVVRGGGMQIVRPDAKHVAYKDLTNAPTWQTKSLTQLSEQCRPTP